MGEVRQSEGPIAFHVWPQPRKSVMRMRLCLFPQTERGRGGQGEKVKLSRVIEPQPHRTRRFSVRPGQCCLGETKAPQARLAVMQICVVYGGTGMDQRGVKRVPSCPGALGSLVGRESTGVLTHVPIQRPGMSPDAKLHRSVAGKAGQGHGLLQVTLGLIEASAVNGGPQRRAGKRRGQPIQLSPHPLRCRPRLLQVQRALGPGKRRLFDVVSSTRLVVIGDDQHELGR
ncbi:hypothetical protein [Streptomyces glaucescens]|uniref:hypothetical protein n=1 Tax=Streptomyces glaucescens TaxID=1907 RepID=UPI00117EAE35|nr:hypothetical protein [Streptomyces glaucescens]